MQLFEGYSADELHRVLNASRWIAGLLFLLAISALILNQWLLYRITEQQKVESDSGRTRLLAAEEELRKMRSEKSAVTNTLDRLTASRKLTPAQVSNLRSTLATAVKGKLVVTYLTVEWDAEEYAHQLGAVLKEIGYDVKISDYIWVDLDHDGLFLVSTAGELPPAARALQAAFGQAGIELPSFPAGAIPKEVGAEQGEIILVVSNR